MFDLVNITKAISDKNRVRILLAVKESPLCVCQLTSLLGLAPSTTSKHINILQSARLLEGLRKGKWVFYKIISNEKNGLIDDVMKLLDAGTKNSADIIKDKENMDKILKEYCDIHNEIHQM